MPKVAVTVTIAASEAQHLVQGGLAAGISVLAAWVTPSPVGAVLAACAAATVIQARRQQPVGQLRCLVDDDGKLPPGEKPDSRRMQRMFRRWLGTAAAPQVPGIWQWRGEEQADWQLVHLQRVAVGGSLIALRWNGRTQWLWPDAMSHTDHHVLRRYLLGMPLGNLSSALSSTNTRERSKRGYNNPL